MINRKSIITFLCGILIIGLNNVSSQNCNEKGILSGANGSYNGGLQSPLNPEKPTAINNLDWRLNPVTNGVYFNYNEPSGNIKQLLSPWHVTDPNCQYSYLAKGTNSDYNPKDGWELFKVNLGRLNDNTTTRYIKPIIPYIILYNRYTGILRVFAHLNRTSDYNTISIELSLDESNTNNGLNYSAILSLTNDVAQPLDEKTKLISVKSITQYPNNQSMFFWADFPIAYDPCVCYKKSNISVRFKALTQGAVNMTGTINGVITPVASITSSPKNVINLISNIGKLVINQNYASAIEAVSSIFDILDMSGDTKDGLMTFLKLLEFNSSSYNSADDKKKAESALTYSTNFLSTMFKSAGASNMSLLKASVSLSGTAVFSYEFNNSAIRFSTPGSKDSHLNPQENYNADHDSYGNLIPEYPAYNEILGTFALLKKPTIQISQAQFGGGYGFDYNRPYNFRYSRMRYKIPNNYLNQIRYAFNPIMHTNFSKTKVKVAVVARLKLGTTIPNTFDGSVFIASGYPMLNMSSVNSKYPNSWELWTPYSYSGDPSQIDGYTYSYGDNGSSTSTNNTYEFVSPLVPLEFIYDLQGEITIGTHSDYWEEWYHSFPQYLQDVRLKFFVDFESNDLGSNGLPNKGNFVFTYPLNINLTRNWVEGSEISINPIIDLNQLRNSINPATQSEVNQFCTGLLDNSTYHAFELETSTKGTKNIIQDKSTKSSGNFFVFPNPATTNLTIKYTLDKSSKISINIYNIYMQEIDIKILGAQRDIGSYTENINISKLPVGTYIIKITKGDKVETTKFIKN